MTQVIDGITHLIFGFCSVLLVLYGAVTRVTIAVEGAEENGRRGSNSLAVIARRIPLRRLRAGLKLNCTWHTGQIDEQDQIICLVEMVQMMPL
jgi:hypothetical protein